MTSKSAITATKKVPESNNDLGASFDSALKNLASPEMKAALELLKNFKTESSTIISDERGGGGMFKMSYSLNTTEGSVEITSISAIAKVWMQHPELSKLEPEYKLAFAITLEEAIMSLEIDADFQGKDFNSVIMMDQVSYVVSS